VRLLNRDGWYPTTAGDDAAGNAVALRQIFNTPRTSELTTNLRF